MGSGTKTGSADKRRAATWLACVVAVASALGLAGAAAAAPPKPKPVEPPKMAAAAMRVVIVRDSRAGCEPNCAEWISALGQITKETPAQFRRVFKALSAKKLPVFISSPGGAVDPAMAIGRDIRKRGLDVAVERTVFAACEPPATSCDLAAIKDGDKGRPDAVGASCSSACVLILAAGKERLVPVYGFVGVHQHHEWRTTWQRLQTFRVQRRIENWRVVEHRELIAEKEFNRKTVEGNPDYAPVRAYYSEMGINTAALMPLLLATPHTGVHRMTPDERRTTRIATRFAAGDALLQSASLEVAGKPDTATPAVTDEPGAAAPLKLVTELRTVYPTTAEAVELFLRVKSSDPPSPGAHYTADIVFAGDKKLVAESTGERPADPLYAALATEDFCVLRRAGNLSMRILIRDAARPERPVQISVDLAKDPLSARFASVYCPSAGQPAKWQNELSVQNMITVPPVNLPKPAASAGAVPKPVPAKN